MLQILIYRRDAGDACLRRVAFLKKSSAKNFNKDRLKSSHFTIENGGVSSLLRTKLVKFIPFLKVFGILNPFFQKGVKPPEARISPINCNFTSRMKGYDLI